MRESGGYTSKDEDPILPTDPRERIEGYLDEMHKDALSASHERWEQARLNNLYYLGKQDQWFDDSRQIKTFWQLGHPYRQRNHLRPLLDTQVGRMVKSLPSVTVKPVTPDAFARGAAEKAAAYVEYQEFEYSLDREHARVALNGLLHGVAGYKITFDKARDANVWQKVRIFDFLVDPWARELADAVWVTFVDHRDRWSAKELVDRQRVSPREMGLGPEQVWSLGMSEMTEASYMPGVTGKERSGVEIHEVWHKPSPRCPEGLWALVVGGKLVKAENYRYMLPSRDTPDRLEAVLPLVLWTPGDADHGLLGASPVDDAIHQQRELNERESHIAHLIKITADVKIIGSKALKDQWQIGKNQWLEADPQMAPVWIDPPRLNPALFSERDSGPDRISEVLGVSGLVAGAIDPKSGQSARSLAYVDELDSLKIALGHRSLQDMIEAGFELDLKLAQVFLSEEKLISLPGGDGVRSMAFRGADLHGVTVRLEPRSGLERYSDQKARSKLEQLGAGLPVDPQEAVRSLDTGQAQDPYVAANKKAAIQDLESILAGGRPNLEADPAIAVEALREAHPLIERVIGPDAADMAKQLAALYARQLQPAASQPVPGEEPEQ